MSIATLTEPILTGDQASGGANNDALLSKVATASRDDAAGPPRIPSSSDAPVTVSELREASPEPITVRGMRKRAERGFYGTPVATHPVYLFAVDRLPVEIRTAVLARRRMGRVEDRRQAMENAQTAPPIYHLPAEMFHDAERAAGLERAKFCNEVTDATRNRTYQTQDECFMAIVGRESRALQMESGKREAEGKTGRYPLLAAVWGANGWRKARASYFVWSKKWEPWRTAGQPLYNYHVLCDHRRFAIPGTGAPEFWSIAGTIKARKLDLEIGALYQEARAQALQSGIPVTLVPEESEFHAAYGSSYKRFGDAGFWKDVVCYYEGTHRKSLDSSFNLARSHALKRGVLPANIPSIDQVKHFYRFHADRVVVQAKRKGKKFVYDHLAYHAERDWSNVHPGSMLVLDGRIMDVWVRIFDKTVGTIDQGTGLRSGGWRPIRPDMIHLIDGSTFKQVAFRLLETPTRDTAEMCLRAVVETYGAPLCLHTDNGKDFSAAFKRRVKIPMDAEALRKVSDALAMRVIFAVNRNPQAKTIERYHAFQAEFEKRFPSYHGHDKEHQDARWKERNPLDGKTLEERLMVYRDGPMKGCLVNPEALPTLDQFTQAWIKWRDEEFERQPMDGKILCGKSPIEKFNSGDSMFRKMDSEEIRMAFMREYDVRTVAKGGCVFYRVPGSDIKVRYYSSALEPFIGAEVQLRIELVPGQFKPRMFAFERATVRRGGEQMETWKQIVCDGVFGSVPLDTELDALNASEDELRQLGRRKSSIQRRILDGRNAEVEMDAHRHALSTLGLETGKSGRHDGAYGLDAAPRQFVPSTQQKREDLERRASLAQERDGMDEELMKSIRGA